MSPADPLLSVSQVARLYGVSARTVWTLVGQGHIPCLDSGVLIEQGKFDVPLIRRSWALALQRDSRGAERRLDGPDGGLHPAAQVALDFHAALVDDDVNTVVGLSSAASRAGLPEPDLMQEWRTALAATLAQESGVGTAIYSLAPFPAVAARIFADPPAIPYAVEKPTPMILVTALPLVEEAGTWRVDLPLHRQIEAWLPLLSEPLPAGSDDESSPAS